jgi:phosphoglycolate phosphatase
MTFRVLLLDFDGTLVETQQAVMVCARRALEEMGHAVPDAALRQAISHSLLLEATIAMLAPEMPPPEIDRAAERYREIYAEVGANYARPFPGVRETLQTVRGSGRILAVVSNKGREAVEHQLAVADLATFVDLIFAAEADMPGKPDAAAFDRRVALAFPGVARSEFLMVGDTATDIRFAKNAGLHSCWAAYGYGDPAACRALKPDRVIASFGGLLTVLAASR